LPGILLHFGYDVTLMSLPLFAASGGGIWLDRTLVALCALIPLWVVLWRRWQTGAWRAFPEALRNGAWQPATLPATPAPVVTEAAVASASLPRRLRLGVVCAGALGLVLWASLSQFGQRGARLTIGRTEAIELARAELDRRGVKLSPAFHADAGVPDRPWSGDRFAWQTAGRDHYDALVGTYVPEARWRVRFARFTGDVAERAEQWDIFLRGDGTIQRLSHTLPEARAGASLTEDEARQRVRAAVREWWNLDPDQLTEVSATSAKRPSRLDWTFVLKDPAVKSLAPGEARLRIELSGDEVTDAFRFVFIPEDWERADRALQSRFSIGRVVKSVTLAGLVLCGLGFGIAAWSRKRFAVRVALMTFVALLVCSLIAALNQWPATRLAFSTAQPLQLQITMAIVGPAVGILIAGAAFALLAGYVIRWLQPPIASEREAVLAGLGVGFALAGGLACAALLRVNAAPPWPALGLLGTYSSWIATLVGVIAQSLTQTVVLLFIFGLLNRLGARSLAAAAVLAFLAGALLLLPWGAKSFGAWLGSTGITALVFASAYVLVLRRDLTLVPMAGAAAAAVNALGNGLARAYPAALFQAIVASALVLAFGWYLMRLLRHFAAARSDSVS
jgi:hypothetical protein